ncbi:dTDP-4-dehydrorhamnose reductase [Phenylobacterium deserti]|uniref:dTDP-4-dehydrorhamnose reductase n=1 Tax=Phenylobacterium deserti TaxID=1914756 RepID=A0A328AR57_9CAUL|nr:dTDP-4-dehydrorhamnose reductase [Phenylobacterium deserti]RAK57500.1 dTDP-4-dehydrorhamnose reductase [Phenylobacterium deserti]
MTTRILQFGATGQLAREVLDRAGGPVEVTALSRADVDLTDADAVRRAILEAGDIDLVVNAAGYTVVDKAESEPDLAYAVNAWAPEAMAKACQERGAPFVHISTDMVFSGAKDGPYLETDLPAPLHVYGASKLLGEQAVLAHCERALVGRVTWLFSPYGQNFVQIMLRLAKTQPVVKVVDDQRARPTASGDVATFLLANAARLAAAPAGAPEWGLLHLVSPEPATRFEMAQRLFELAGLAPPMEPVPTSAFPTPARRALNAELDSTRLQTVFGGEQLRPWHVALADVVQRMRAAEGVPA